MGARDGSAVGAEDGSRVGTRVGKKVGAKVGSRVGCRVGSGVNGRVSVRERISDRVFVSTIEPVRESDIVFVFENDGEKVVTRLLDMVS